MPLEFSHYQKDTVMRPVISRVHIRNMYGHLSFDLDLHPDITFLYGPNGCGKSAVLQALHDIITEGLPVGDSQIILSNGRVLTGREDYEDAPYSGYLIGQDRGPFWSNHSIQRECFPMFDRILKAMNLLMAEGRQLQPLDCFSLGEAALYDLLELVVPSADDEIVYLIDCPEQHLHVDTQRRLVKAIRQLNDRQLVIATHSPEIMADYKNSQIAEVKANG